MLTTIQRDGLRLYNVKHTIIALHGYIHSMQLGDDYSIMQRMSSNKATTIVDDNVVMELIWQSASDDSVNVTANFDAEFFDKLDDDPLDVLDVNF